MVTTTDKPGCPLRMLLERFRSEAGGMSYESLLAYQEPSWPLGSLADGAGGSAYALYCMGRSSGSRWECVTADKWLNKIMADAYTHNMFEWTGLGDRDSSSKNSILCSEDGIKCARILLSKYIYEKFNFDIELDSLLAVCYKNADGPVEFMAGISGYLNVLTIIYRSTRNQRALAVVNDLANNLLSRAVTDGPQSWVRDSCLTFAHGRAGVFYALLNWSNTVEGELPGWFFESLRDLAHEVENTGTMGAPMDLPTVFRRSWCKGSAGLTILWAKAFECTGVEKFIDLAREAAMFSLTEFENSPGTLCCGLGGRAYALLAMDRIEPNEGWYEAAYELTVFAVRQGPSLSGYWSRGLYRGYSGLICLAQDLLVHRNQRTGFPLVEG